MQDISIQIKIFIKPSHMPNSPISNKSPYPSVCFLYIKDVIINGIPRYPIPTVNPKSISFLESRFRYINIKSRIIKKTINDKGNVKVLKSIIDTVINIELINRK